jgi:fatty-acyl-CoA synthase
MPVKIVAPTASAYAYPLLIKQLLLTPLATVPEREITYQGRVRYTYRTLAERIARLAGGLQVLGVEAGQTVAMMDWDSHRYLECFFAVPMMGAVLQTVNVRLSPEQILYTLNHARAEVLLVNAEFFPILEQIAPRLESVRRFVFFGDDAELPAAPLAMDAEYEAMLAAAPAEFDFPDFRRERAGVDLIHDRHERRPKGIYFSHRQLVLHTWAVPRRRRGPRWARPSRALCKAEHPDVPVHAWGFPFLATMIGMEFKYIPAATSRTLNCRLIDEKMSAAQHACRPSALVPRPPKGEQNRFRRLVGADRRFGAARGDGRGGAEAASTGLRGFGMSGNLPGAGVGPHGQRRPSPIPPDAQAVIRARTGRPLPLVDLRIVDQQCATSRTTARRA